MFGDFGKFGSDVGKFRADAGQVQGRGTTVILERFSSATQCNFDRVWSNSVGSGQLVGRAENPAWGTPRAEGSLFHGGPDVSHFPCLSRLISPIARSRKTAGEGEIGESGKCLIVGSQITLLFLALCVS